MRGRRRLSRAFWFPSPAHRCAFAGTYVALVCPNNDTTAPCQLNAHVIAMVAPESILHGLRVGASFDCPRGCGERVTAETIDDHYAEECRCAGWSREGALLHTPSSSCSPRICPRLPA